MRLAVLTGGGDSPGLNAAIRAFVGGTLVHGHEVLGVRYGWRGIAVRDTRVLDRRAIEGILPRGGTILGTSSYDCYHEEGDTKAVIAGTRALSLDGVVAIRMGRVGFEPTTLGLKVPCSAS